MTATVYTNRYAKFRKLLVNYRDKKGLTQKAFGEKIGMRQSEVSKYERGVRRLDIIELIDIAEALNIDPCDIITELKKIKK